MNSSPLGEGARVAILMQGYLCDHFGKLGFGMLRYSPAEIVAVVDADHAGDDLPSLTGIPCCTPIVSSSNEARDLGAEALVLGVAPPGGKLPQDWWEEVLKALRLGMLVVNPLHKPLSTNEEVRRLGGRVWDVRVEPPDLDTAAARALVLSCARVLTVGTDMAVGKMTASLEMTFAARRIGVAAEFVATGQTGICIWGSGVAVDAVRLDFAPGAVERETLRAASESGADVLFIEGQGAINHPAASATLAIMRGCMPTHLVLCARAQQRSLWRFPDLRIPPVRSLIETYETMAAGGGVFPRPQTIGIALDTHELDESQALQAGERLESEVGLPVVDPVRHGAARLVEWLVQKR
ncbi:MAG: DUF1611 domain-containing protein [Armatimonadota bacterium]